MPEISPKAKPIFLKPKGFKKSQISGIWLKKGQYGNPANSVSTHASAGNV